MKTLYTLVAVAFFLCAPVWFGYVAYRDLTHPENWGQDWTNDPRVYLPLAAVAVPLVVWAWRRECLNAKRRTDVMLAPLRRQLIDAYAELDKAQRERRGND